MKFNQIIVKNSDLLSFAILLICILANAQNIFAQFTFAGDYDRVNFAAPNGYYVEPQNNFPGDPTPNRRTYLFTGELNPDGSIIAGGRIERNGGDFWLRKFTASGTPDPSFGAGTGYVRTVFSTGFDGTQGNSIPTVLKRQADGKIVFGGVCDVLKDQANANANVNFGTDWCLVRYNADGSIDSNFGNNIVLWSNGPNITYSQAVGAGRVATQTAFRESGLLGGTGLAAQLSDLAIQPDGKIVAVGYTRSETHGALPFRTEGIVIRYNASGSIDTTFGTNGIARFIPANSGTASSPCYAQREFFAIRLQPDGRIIAVGYDGVADATGGGCNPGGTFFVVTRWTANGQLETVRRLDGNTNVFARENAVSALITNDGGKLLVSGNYQDTPTLARFNLSDLTLDGSFGTNGVIRYTGLLNRSLYIEAIQSDGKILAIDGATNYPVSRLNPDGSPDNSFGNVNFDNNIANTRGRLNIPVNTFNTTNTQPLVGHILLRPNGKFNLIGQATANEGGNSPRAFVSQNINAISARFDFDADGGSDISVFRGSDSNWYRLNSSDGTFGAFNWGLSSDKVVPADYDGDGKTDHAVFRNGTWYIFQSSNGQVRGVQFGLSADMPRPGDFDGDGKADICVFRPSDGIWYFLKSSNGQFSAFRWGTNGDVPMLGDYDNDGKADFSVFRPSNGYWYIYRSSDNQVRFDAFGAAGDIPLSGDFNGDGESDLAVFRPSTGVWYVARPIGVPAQQFDATKFGTTGDIPVPADYDKDGETDIAVYRNGVWFILKSSNGQAYAVNFGLSNDKPIPAAYVP